MFELLVSSNLLHTINSYHQNNELAVYIVYCYLIVGPSKINMSVVIVFKYIGGIKLCIDNAKILSNSSSVIFRKILKVITSKIEKKSFKFFTCYYPIWQFKCWGLEHILVHSNTQK